MERISMYFFLGRASMLCLLLGIVEAFFPRSLCFGAVVPHKSIRVEANQPDPDFLPGSTLPSWVPPSGLQAYFPLDGDFLDVSGNGYNGTSVGSVPFIADRKGRLGKAMQGGGGYVLTSNQFFRFSRTAQFTVSVWFTVTSNGCSGRLLSTESPEGLFRIANASGGQIVVQFGDYLYPMPVTPNAWHHLVYVYDNKNEKIYMDGSLVLTNIDQAADESFVYGAPFTIGAKASSAYDPWCGNIDEVGVWNRPLTAEEVSQLYTEQVSPLAVTDIDGNNYKTVTIGNQIWMKENLRVSRYRNGDVIANVSGGYSWSALNSGAYVFYNNNASDNSTYGKLYNWFAISDNRGLCPTGWHIPNDEEWGVLTDFLGGLTNGGGKMKVTGTTFWQSPNSGATNESGFSGLPGGYCDNNGNFRNQGTNGYIWGLNEYNNNSAWHRALNYDNVSIYRNLSDKRTGLTVRCLKDESALSNTAPSAISLSSNSVQENQASGTTIGTLSATDAEGGTLVYSLVSGPGSTDNASFTISGIVLNTASVLDYESKSNYSILVRVTDGGGLFYEKTFNINVTDMPEPSLPAWLPQTGLQAYFPLDGNFLDVGGKEYNGSAVGSVPFIADRKGQAGKAMQGGGGYVPTSNQFFRFSRTAQFTVSVWFTVTSNGCSGRLLSTESPEGLFRIANASGGQIVVQFGDYLYPTPVTPNAWHHLVYVYDNKNEKVYMDGALVLTNIDQAADESFVYGAPFTIGAKASSAYDRWCGNIDEVGVWNRPLTAAEVTQLYTEQVPALTVTDIDGNTYNTVTIGNQVWMKENLKTSRYNNGDPIPLISDVNQWISTGSGASCYYNNSSIYQNISGKLYNWYTAADSRNICPSGWHVPTDAEWTQLTNFLGGLNVAGGKMKQTGTSSWASPNVDATNSSGFTAIPGGFRASASGQSLPSGAFAAISSGAFFWSSSSESGSLGWDRQLANYAGEVTPSGDYKNVGMSIRCIRDESALNAQTITFIDVSALTYGNQDVALSAIASSGLPVTYSSSNTSVAEIFSGNILKINSAGDVTITASQAGNSQYAPASASQNISIGKALLNITADNISKTYGDVDPTPTLTYSGFRLGEGASVLDNPPVTTLQVLGTPSGSAYYGVEDCTLNGFTITGGSASVTSSGYIGCGISLGQDIDLRTQRSDFGFGTYELYAKGGNGFANQYFVINDLFTADVRPLGTDDVGWALYGPSGKLAHGTPPVSYPNWYKMKLRYTPDSVKFWLGNTLVYQAAVNFGINPASAWGANSYSQSFFDEFKFTPYQTATPVDAGSYVVSVACGTDNNYVLNCVNGNYTINKASLNITAGSKERLYGEANPVLTLAYSGFKNGEKVDVLDAIPTATTTATFTSSVGTYPITASGGSDNNYTFEYEAGELKVEKAVLTVTADNQTKTYGDANPALTLAYSGFKNDEKVDVLDTAPTATTTAMDISPVGAYPITLSGGLDNNYSFEFEAGELKVEKAVLTVTADNQTKTYGDANPALTLAYSGFKNDEKVDVLDTAPTATTTATVTSSVGTYPITASGGSDNNYTFEYEAGELKVDKAVLTATADNQTKIYGDANPALTFAYSGFKNNETSSVLDAQPVVSTAATLSSNAGTYPITITEGSDNNYTFSYQPGVLTITKAELLATAEDKTRAYGEANPELTVAITGFKNNETFSVIDTPPAATTEANVSSNVGSYAIKPSGGSDNNYSFKYKDGTLTIGKETVTVTAADKSRIYGESNPIFTVTYSGFKNGENETVLDEQPKISTAANTLTDAGTWPISLSGGSDSNYDLKLVNGVLTINKAELLVKAEDKVRLYGDSNPVFSFTYAGFKNNDQPNNIDQAPLLSTTATAASNTGSYPIELAGGSDNNYTFNFTPGTLTVNKANITATADNKSRGYGDSNPELTIAYQGFKNNDQAGVIDTAPVASTLAKETSDAGTYAISLSEAADNNYSIKVNPGILTVNKAILVAKADDKSRPYNTDNPELTISYSGLKNNETSTVLDKQPVISTTALKSSLPGAYAITLSGGSDNNYSLTYQDGTLTVTKLTQTLTFTLPATLFQDQSPYTLTATSSSGLPIKFALVEGNASVTGNTLTINGPGTIKVKAFQEGTEIYAPVEVVQTATVPNSFVVSGLITKPGNVPLGTGLAKLFYEDGGLAKNGTVTNGNYKIELVRPGRYVLQVVPQGNDDSEVFPAYYNSAQLNKDATIIVVEGDVTVSMEMPAKPKNQEKGPGEIKGKVVTGNSGGGRFIVGRIAEGTGLPNVPVYLLEATTDKVLRTVSTDKDGFFTISEVPTGNYRLGLDVVGASLANTATSISITPQNPVLEVSAVISESSSGTPVVGLEVEVITALKEFGRSLLVNPNPVDEELTIRYQTEDPSMIRVMLYDLNGRKMKEKLVDQFIPGEVIIQLSLGELSLSQGIYLLQLQQGGEVKTVKVMKR